jgi:hypothetical protein
MPSSLRVTSLSTDVATALPTDNRFENTINDAQGETMPVRDLLKLESLFALSKIKPVLKDHDHPKWKPVPISPMQVLSKFFFCTASSISVNSTPNIECVAST